MDQDEPIEWAEPESTSYLSFFVETYDEIISLAALIVVLIILVGIEMYGRVSVSEPNPLIRWIEIILVILGIIAILVSSWNRHRS